MRLCPKSIPFHLLLMNLPLSNPRAFFLSDENRIQHTKVLGQTSNASFLEKLNPALDASILIVIQSNELVEATGKQTEESRGESIINSTNSIPKQLSHLIELIEKELAQNPNFRSNLNKINIYKNLTIKKHAYSNYKTAVIYHRHSDCSYYAHWQKVDSSQALRKTQVTKTND